MRGRNDLVWGASNAAPKKWREDIFSLRFEPRIRSTHRKQQHYRRATATRDKAAGTCAGRTHAVRTDCRYGTIAPLSSFTLCSLTGCVSGGEKFRPGFRGTSHLFTSVRGVERSLGHECCSACFSGEDDGSMNGFGSGSTRA